MAWSEMLPPQGAPHLLVIDGANLWRRSWHVQEQNGSPEAAAPAALRTFARLLRARQPTHVLFAGEGRGSVRKALWDGYKAKRPPKPEGLLACEAFIAAALAGAGVPLFSVAGLEADDVLAGAALLARQASLPAVLVTNDRDVEQVVDDAMPVVLWDGAERVLDEGAVEKRWGVPPAKLGELFALTGQDDEAPGVHGWGPARAATILNGAGRPLDVLLREGGAWWIPSKFRAKFVEHTATIALSYDLVRLRGAEAATKIVLEDLEVRPLDVAEALIESAGRS